MGENEKQPDEPEFKGILMTDGVELTIHGLQLRLTEAGPEMSTAGTSLRQDMCRHWLWIATRHAFSAADANADLTAADEKGDHAQLHESLEAEFRSSMQAMVASAVAIDAFYVAVRERIAIPDELVQSWREKRTARWRQQGEVLRLAFGLSPEKTKELRKILSEMAKYRGWAVHPAAGQEAPVRHPELARGVEWRFVAFRFENARSTVRMALSVVDALVGHETPRPEGLTKYCENMKQALDPLVADWAERFPNSRAR